MKKLYFSLFLALIFGKNLLGQSWTNHNPGFPDPTLGCSSLDVVNENVIWAVFTHYSVTDTLFGFFQDSICLVTVSTDGGATWTTHQAPMGNPAFVANITAIDGNVAWLSGLDGGGGGSKILKTVDGGATWAEQTSAAWDPVASWADFVYFKSPAVGIAMGDPRNGEFEIYITANGGQFWTPVPGSNIPDPLPGEYGYNGDYDVVGNTIWFGTSMGGVYRSTTSGSSWERFESGQPEGYLDFGDNMHGIYWHNDYNNFHSYASRSTDGGETWTELTSLPEGGNYRLESLRYIPGSNYIILSTTQTSILTGVYKTYVSKDDGDTWLQIDEGHHLLWMDFINPETGWGGQSQKLSGPSYLFEYTGSPIAGLFGPKPLEAEVSVYPNPVSDIVNVEVQSSQPTDYLLLVNDSQGHLVKKLTIEKTASFRQTLDLGGLPAGAYTVTVSNATGCETRTVIKQ